MLDFIVDKENFTRILNVVRSLTQKQKNMVGNPSTQT